MQQPTDDQIAEFESTALSKSKISSTVLELPIEEAGVTLFLRPLSFDEFRDYANGATDKTQTVNVCVQALFRAALWPARGEIHAAYGVFPGLRKRACDDGINYLAGAPDSAAPESWYKVDDELTDEVLAELDVPAERMAALRTQYQYKGQLALCRIPGSELFDAQTIVVKRPTIEAWNRAAGRMQENMFDAMRDLAVDCVVYPEAPEFSKVLASRPALPVFVLRAKLFEMANGTASHSQKKVVRRGRGPGA